MLHNPFRRMKHYENAITEGVIWQQLLIFFFPILLGTFFQQLYNTVDAMIVGNVVGKEALAAVGGATGSIINLLVGFFVGLSSGATVIISQLYGASQYRDVSRGVHTAVALSLIFGVILTASGVVLAEPLLSLMQTPEDVMPYALSYMRIIFMGMVPVLVYNIGAGILRAVGDSRHPLYFLIVACFTNIVLDLLFIAVLKTGTSGAALATVVSQTVAAVLTVFSLAHRQDCCRLQVRKIRIEPSLLKKIFRIGLPAGLQSVMYSLSNVIIQACMNGFTTDILAGWTAYGKLDGLYWMTISAFGIAITTFVGQNFGAGQYRRVRQSVRTCLLMTVISTIVMGGIMLLLGETLYRIFTPDADVVREGLRILRFMVPFYFTYLTIEVLSGALRGTGDSLVPTLMVLFGVCFLRVIWLLVLLPRFHTLETLLYSYPVSWLLTSGLFAVYYLKRPWIARGKKEREA